MLRLTILGFILYNTLSGMELSHQYKIEFSISPLPKVNQPMRFEDCKPIKGLPVYPYPETLAYHLSAAGMEGVTGSTSIDL